MAGKTVVVTGANGFIASWLVKMLLDRGYKIILWEGSDLNLLLGGIVDPDDVDKVGHLLELPGAKERLQLFKASLQDVGCFDEVVFGADGVFHVASPISSPGSTDPEEFFVVPAVEGTLNVLQAAAKSESVKRVVITSSIVGMDTNDRPRDAETVVDETWWSDPEFCKKHNNSYARAKIKAELAAWEFAKVNGMDLVVLHPCLTIGALLQSKKNASISVMLGEINGVMGSTTGYVDVKDVAWAHVLAFEKPSAEGRYILSAGTAHKDEIIKLIEKFHPSFKPTAIDEVAWEPPPPSPNYNSEKAKRLGVTFAPLEVSIKESVESLRVKNLLED